MTSSDQVSTMTTIEIICVLVTKNLTYLNNNNNNNNNNNGYF